MGNKKLIETWEKGGHKRGRIKRDRLEAVIKYPENDYRGKHILCFSDLRGHNVAHDMGELFFGLAEEKIVAKLF